MGTQLSSPRGHTPQFSAHVCCDQTAGWIKMPLGTEVGLVPGDIALDWDRAPHKRGVHSIPKLWLMYCGQTAGWIKMPLGTGVCLGPGHTVLHGDPASPLQKGAQNRPIFGPFLLWPNGWMDQDATWYWGRHRPRQHCLRWGSSPGHIVLDGDPALFSPKIAWQSPVFGSCPLWPNGRPSKLLLSTCSAYVATCDLSLTHVHCTIIHEKAHHR